MAQIFKGLNNPENIYKTRFDFGDIVRIINIGWTYQTFFDLYDLIGIKNYGTRLAPDNTECVKENWVICNIIAYELQPFEGKRTYEIIYHIKNKKGKSLVIGEGGLRKRYMKINPTKSLKKEIEFITDINYYNLVI